MNTLVAAATASIRGGGEKSAGEGGTERPENSIEELKNVHSANLIFIDLSCFIYSKTGVVFGKLNIEYAQIKFFFRTFVFCLPPPLQPQFFPNQPPGLPVYIAWKQVRVLSKTNYN